MVTLFVDDRWAFYQHPHGGWSWQTLGVEPRDSDGYFVGIVDAIADATRNGFEPGVSKITSFGRSRVG